MSFRRVIRNVAKGVGVVCIPIAFCDLVGHPAAVVGSSMEPTLHGQEARWWDNDIIWLSKWYTGPKAGDIFTFISPQDPTTQHIKRVAAGPGDFIRMKNGMLTALGANDYWMMSDNQTVGKDSRTYGPVNVGLFQGKAKFIMWPPSRIGKV